MADFWEKLWHGLRGELLRTILLAVTVSILLYTGLQPVSRVVLQSFYTNSDFLQTKTDAVGTLIQQNVAESGISSRQVRRITTGTRAATSPAAASCGWRRMAWSSTIPR